ncbi:MAG TPA: hypothetical protein ENI23_17900 [bacterium]|nr:hypothetical protein [bacterium]
MSSNNPKELADLLKPLFHYYQRETILLIKEMLKEGFTKAHIAEVLDKNPSGVTRQLQRFDNIKPKKRKT